MIYRLGQKSWKIHHLSQCNVSFPCLRDCIDTFAGYTKVDICEENQYEVLCGENNLNYLLANLLLQQHCATCI